MRERDAEVVIAAACLFHDSGMSIHRTDHESYSLFLAAEALHAIIGHRRRGDPMTIEAGIFQVDELLATKLRGSGLEQHVEVVARIDAEHEKRLLPVFRI